MRLTKVEMSEVEARLFVATVNILLASGMDVARAMPELVAKMYGDKKLMVALLLSAANDPHYGLYYEELLTADLMRRYATQVAVTYNRVEVANV